jgi:predicted ATP-grasp superfamily ATP-dependent carboligase
VIEKNKIASDIISRVDAKLRGSVGEKRKMLGINEQVSIFHTLEECHYLASHFM